ALIAPGAVFTNNGSLVIDPLCTLTTQTSLSRNIINQGALFLSGGITLSGAISGTGSVTAADAGTKTLSGTNTYTGPTTVAAGTLSLSTPFLANDSIVTIASGAVLNLPHGNTDQVGALVLNGNSQPNGTYGALGSADPSDIEVPYITGPGRIRVQAATPYQQWAQDYNLAGNNYALSANPDGDGASNLEEFALGGNPNSASDAGSRSVQMVDTDNNAVEEFTLTIEVRSGASFTPNGTELVASVDGITYRVQGSLELAQFNSSVSEVVPHLGTGAPSPGYKFATFRLNASNGMAGGGFLRVVVTAP
ncbi:MAG TPA: autotransporter-associated beta strand repeat-containing protein, partial [Chthoniobacterales bacterium]|nr:autotransporter-associated beta strand repeat-containing protein [Chthoniobacterales bacterium]